MGSQARPKRARTLQAGRWRSQRSKGVETQERAVRSGPLRTRRACEDTRSGGESAGTHAVRTTRARDPSHELGAQLGGGRCHGTGREAHSPGELVFPRGHVTGLAAPGPKLRGGGAEGEVASRRPGADGWRAVYLGRVLGLFSPGSLPRGGGGATAPPSFRNVDAIYK